MGLNKQLLCVSLLLLCLPWAGCQYLVEMDSILRASQQRAQMASTQAIAAVLSERSAEPANAFYRTQSAADQENANDHTPLYFYSLHAPVWIDGYDDGWETIPGLTYISSQRAASSVYYQTAIFEQTLYLFFKITDGDINYNDPSRSLLHDGDHIKLVTANRTYSFTTAAPGPVTARYSNSQGKTYRESKISAHWQDSDSGYHLEIAIPIALVNHQLAFTVVDQQHAVNGSAPQAGRYGPFSEDRPMSTISYKQHPPITQIAPPRYRTESATLNQQLAIFVREGQRFRIVDAQGWTTAQQGSLKLSTSTESHWLLRRIYRHILYAQTSQHPAFQQAANISQRREVAAALDGEAASVWYQDADRHDQYIVASAAPIFYHDASGTNVDTNVAGAVIAEQSSEQMAALSDRAFNRLLSLSLIVITIVGLGLLTYASWLSWRIRKLSRMATTVINDDGQWSGVLPQSRARDEIGELTRNYNTLLQRIRDYTEYLQTLSRKLSHELRTPLAIIHSSLDNLHNENLQPQSHIYQQRAKTGALRLGAILTAMSEASRLEETIEQAEFEQVDLPSLLMNVCQAYSDLYQQNPVQFINKLERETTAGKVELVPDLLVQLLDKLVDNAISFSPERASIVCTLDRNNDHFCIAVKNTGPLLPEKMHGRLFDNMVSLRDAHSHVTDNDNKVGTPHLGLGLYIVNLIVNYHGGWANAENLPDQSGVIFMVYLPVKKHNL